MKTIVALVDHSDVTPKVLDQAHRLSRALGGSVTLINVLPEAVVAEFGAVLIAPEDLNAARQKLLALRDSLAARGTTATAVQAQGPIVDTILSKCKPLSPDLLIMGSHGHGALYNLLVGSVTAGILKRAACPVLVVPSNAELRAEAAADVSDDPQPDFDETGFAND
jgi:nucleotide-binding universal stress UspA family protein